MCDYKNLKESVKESIDNNENIDIADICPLDKFDELKDAVKVELGLAKSPSVLIEDVKINKKD